MLMGYGSYFYMSTVTGTERLELSQEFFENYFDADLDDLEGAIDYAEKNYSEMFDIPRLAKFAIVPMVFNAHPGHHDDGIWHQHLCSWRTWRHTTFYEEYDWLLNGTSPWLFQYHHAAGYTGYYLDHGVLYNPFSLESHLSIIGAILMHRCSCSSVIYHNVVLFRPLGVCQLCYVILIFHFLSWEKATKQHHG